MVGEGRQVIAQAVDSIHSIAAAMAQAEGDMTSLRGEAPAAGFEFVNALVGNNIPPEYVPACEKGFREAMAKGAQIGHPVQGVRVTLTDGAAHAVDSNEMAFRLAAQYAFRAAFLEARPGILEPIMKVEVALPHEYQGTAIALLNKRIATPVPAIVVATIMAVTSLVLASVPGIIALVRTPDMFGDGTALLAMIYYGIVPTVFGFWMWYTGASLLSGAEASTFTAVAPMTAMLLSVLVLGETMQLRHVAGLGLVLAAIAITVTSQRVAPVQRTPTGPEGR
jgi:translation elongation factor EF-G